MFQPPPDGKDFPLDNPCHPENRILSPLASHHPRKPQLLRNLQQREKLRFRASKTPKKTDSWLKKPECYRHWKKRKRCSWLIALKENPQKCFKLTEKEGDRVWGSLKKRVSLASYSFFERQACFIRFFFWSPWKHTKTKRDALPHPKSHFRQLTFCGNKMVSPTLTCR